MQTKKQLTIIMLITCLMVTSILYGEIRVSGSGADAQAGLGWQEQTRRVSVFITDGLKITTGPSLNTTGFGWSVGISSNVMVIECCRWTTLKQSWCNYNADNERCKD